mgnify:CR=1 FL=1
MPILYCVLDQIFDSALTLARRLPPWVVFGSIGVVNLALLALGLLLLGSISLIARLVIELLWAATMIFTLVSTIIGFGAMLLNDDYFQLLGLQRQPSDLRAMSWQDFERLVGELFRKQGFKVKMRGGPDADGGVDLEFESPHGRCLVQCKKWHWQLVGVGKVRELFGVMHAEGAREAMFVTAGLFSPEAIRFAEGKPLRLIDGHEVWRMVQAAGLKSADQTSEGPGVACPKCAKPMELRGSPKIWGCTNYPACKGWRRARAQDLITSVINQPDAQLRSK